jgi:CheY-like chemotaxis protein
MHLSTLATRLASKASKNIHKVCLFAFMDAPSVLALLDNLFFAAKLNAAAKSAGVTLLTARNAALALEKAQAAAPMLIVIDLDAAACEPLSFIRQLKEDDQLCTIPLLGFVAHVNTGLQQQAREAGCDRVLARSVFSRDLPKLLRELSGTGRSTMQPGA